MLRRCLRLFLRSLSALGGGDVGNGGNVGYPLIKISTRLTSASKLKAEELSLKLREESAKDSFPGISGMETTVMTGEFSELKFLSKVIASARWG